MNGFELGRGQFDIGVVEGVLEAFHEGFFMKYSCHDSRNAAFLQERATIQL